jgi:hypothetical protein
MWGWVWEMGVGDEQFPWRLLPARDHQSRSTGVVQGLVRHMRGNKAHK